MTGDLKRLITVIWEAFPRESVPQFHDFPNNEAYGDEDESYRVLRVRAAKAGTGRTETFRPLKHLP